MTSLAADVPVGARTDTCPAVRVSHSWAAGTAVPSRWAPSRAACPRPETGYVPPPRRHRQCAGQQQRLPAPGHAHASCVINFGSPALPTYRFSVLIFQLYVKLS